MQIRPALRVAFLGGIFFILFFTFIANVNFISSLGARQAGYLREQDAARGEQKNESSKVYKIQQEKAEQLRQSGKAKNIESKDLIPLLPLKQDENSIPETPVTTTTPQSGPLRVN
jgi:hypothetical protein